MRFCNGSGTTSTAWIRRLDRETQVSPAPLAFHEEFLATVQGRRPREPERARRRCSKVYESHRDAHAFSVASNQTRRSVRAYPPHPATRRRGARRACASGSAAARAEKPGYQIDLIQLFNPPSRRASCLVLAPAEVAVRVRPHARYLALDEPALPYQLLGDGRGQHADGNAFAKEVDLGGQVRYDDDRLSVMNGHRSRLEVTRRIADDDAAMT